MPRNPLFTTYRQPENRVTASMLAVFERLGLDTLEQLLARATNEASLGFVNFKNQVTGPESVPDAAISGSFQYLFEVKVVRNTLRGSQLRSHLGAFDPRFSDQRLIVITPDAVEPAPVGALADTRLLWVSFAGLAQAADDLVFDPQQALAEQERFLLRELRALFEEEGLLSTDDTVVVAAQVAYREYLTYSAYICQTGRTFRSDATYMGFYAKRAIQPEIARITTRTASVPFTHDHAASLLQDQDPAAQAIASLVEQTLRDGTRKEGVEYQVFLLSPPGSDETVKLPAAVANDAVDRNGQPTAWVQGQRYTQLARLRQATRTSDLTTNDLASR